ncbi:hypothetical protein ADUPG1_009676 [Aduncisulcus paluster]|uniref:Uncharacterized protein n=1 Tax=Aduncisulcus paluster TaxID=2918883 RepID=A0ABQ5KWE1_9EUKA|nr:hypothetical protein ADUPG1_009676 [Aduncisulcus paluster]
MSFPFVKLIENIPSHVKKCGKIKEIRDYSQVISSQFEFHDKKCELEVTNYKYSCLLVLASYTSFNAHLFDDDDSSIQPYSLLQNEISDIFSHIFDAITALKGRKSRNDESIHQIISAVALYLVSSSIPPSNAILSRLLALIIETISTPNIEISPLLYLLSVLCSVLENGFSLLCSEILCLGSKITQANIGNKAGKGLRCYSAENISPLYPISLISPVLEQSFFHDSVINDLTSYSSEKGDGKSSDDVVRAPIEIHMSIFDIQRNNQKILVSHSQKQATPIVPNVFLHSLLLCAGTIGFLSHRNNSVFSSYFGILSVSFKRFFVENIKTNHRYFLSILIHDLFRLSSHPVFSAGATSVILGIGRLLLTFSLEQHSVSSICALSTLYINNLSLHSHDLNFIERIKKHSNSVRSNLISREKTRKEQERYHREIIEKEDRRQALSSKLLSHKMKSDPNHEKNDIEIDHAMFEWEDSDAPNPLFKSKGVDSPIMVGKHSARHSTPSVSTHNRSLNNYPCMCSKGSSLVSIECSICHSRFHSQCVSMCGLVDSLDEHWACPLCKSLCNSHTFYHEFHQHELERWMWHSIGDSVPGYGGQCARILGYLWEHGLDKARNAHPISSEEQPKKTNTPLFLFPLNVFSNSLTTLINASVSSILLSTCMSLGHVLHRLVFSLGTLSQNIPQPRINALIHSTEGKIEKKSDTNTPLFLFPLNVFSNSLTTLINASVSSILLSTCMSLGHVLHRLVFSLGTLSQNIPQPRINALIHSTEGKIEKKSDVTILKRHFQTLIGVFFSSQIILLPLLPQPYPQSIVNALTSLSFATWPHGGVRTRSSVMSMISQLMQGVLTSREANMADSVKIILDERILVVKNAKKERKRQLFDQKKSNILCSRREKSSEIKKTSSYQSSKLSRSSNSKLIIPDETDHSPSPSPTSSFSLEQDMAEMTDSSSSSFSKKCNHHKPLSCELQGKRAMKEEFGEEFGEDEDEEEEEEEEEDSFSTESEGIIEGSDSISQPKDETNALIRPTKISRLSDTKPLPHHLHPFLQFMSLLPLLSLAFSSSSSLLRSSAVSLCSPLCVLGGYGLSIGITVSHAVSMMFRVMCSDKDSNIRLKSKEKVASFLACMVQNTQKVDDWRKKEEKRRDIWRKKCQLRWEEDELRIKKEKERKHKTSTESNGKRRFSNIGKGKGRELTSSEVPSFSSLPFLSSPFCNNNIPTLFVTSSYSRSSLLPLLSIFSLLAQMSPEFITEALVCNNHQGTINSGVLDPNPSTVSQDIIIPASSFHSSNIPQRMFQGSLSSFLSSPFFPSLSSSFPITTSPTNPPSIITSPLSLVPMANVFTKLHPHFRSVLLLCLVPAQWVEQTFRDLVLPLDNSAATKQFWVDHKTSKRKVEDDYDSIDDESCWTDEKKPKKGRGRGRGRGSQSDTTSSKGSKNLLFSLVSSAGIASISNTCLEMIVWMTGAVIFGALEKEERKEWSKYHQKRKETPTNSYITSSLFACCDEEDVQAKQINPIPTPELSKPTINKKKISSSFLFPSSFTPSILRTCILLLNRIVSLLNSCLIAFPLIAPTVLPHLLSILVQAEKEHRNTCDLEKLVHLESDSPISTPFVPSKQRASSAQQPSRFPPTDSLSVNGQAKQSPSSSLASTPRTGLSSPDSCCSDYSDLRSLLVLHLFNKRVFLSTLLSHLLSLLPLLLSHTQGGETEFIYGVYSDRLREAAQSVKSCPTLSKDSNSIIECPSFVTPITVDILSNLSPSTIHKKDSIHLIIPKVILGDLIEYLPRLLCSLFLKPPPFSLASIVQSLRHVGSQVSLSHSTTNIHKSISSLFIALRNASNPILIVSPEHLFTQLTGIKIDGFPEKEGEIEAKPMKKKLSVGDIIGKMRYLIRYCMICASIGTEKESRQIYSTVITMVSSICLNVVKYKREILKVSQNGSKNNTNNALNNSPVISIIASCISCVGFFWEIYPQWMGEERERKLLQWSSLNHVHFLTGDLFLDGRTTVSDDQCDFFARNETSPSLSSHELLVSPMFPTPLFLASLSYLINEMNRREEKTRRERVAAFCDIPKHTLTSFRTAKLSSTFGASQSLHSHSNEGSVTSSFSVASTKETAHDIHSEVDQEKYHYFEGMSKVVSGITTISHIYPSIINSSLTHTNPIARLSSSLILFYLVRSRLLFPSTALLPIIAFSLDPDFRVSVSGWWTIDQLKGLDLRSVHGAFGNDIACAAIVIGLRNHSDDLSHTPAHISALSSPLLPWPHPLSFLLSNLIEGLSQRDQTRRINRICSSLVRGIAEGWKMTQNNQFTTGKNKEETEEDRDEEDGDEEERESQIFESEKVEDMPVLDSTREDGHSGTNMYQIKQIISSQLSQHSQLSDISPPLSPLMSKKKDNSLSISTKISLSQRLLAYHTLVLCLIVSNHPDIALNTCIHMLRLAKELRERDGMEPVCVLLCEGRQLISKMFNFSQGQLSSGKISIERESKRIDINQYYTQFVSVDTSETNIDSLISREESRG